MNGPVAGRNAAGGDMHYNGEGFGTGDAAGGDLLWGGY